MKHYQSGKECKHTERHFHGHCRVQPLYSNKKNAKEYPTTSSDERSYMASCILAGVAKIIIRSKWSEGKRIGGGKWKNAKLSNRNTEQDSKLGKERSYYCWKRRRTGELKNKQKQKQNWQQKLRRKNYYRELVGPSSFLCNSLKNHRFFYRRRRRCRYHCKKTKQKSTVKCNYSILSLPFFNQKKIYCFLSLPVFSSNCKLLPICKEVFECFAKNQEF